MEVKYKLLFTYVPYDASHDSYGTPRITKHSVICDSVGDLQKVIKDLRRANYEIGRFRYGLADLFSFKVERIQTTDITDRVKKASGLGRWEP